MIRTFVYDVARRSVDYRMRQWFKSQVWFTPVLSLVFGNTAYSKSYYEQVEDVESESVESIAEWICHNLGPRRAIDVGCGPGHLMAALCRRGVQVYGVDISRAAERIVASKGLPFQQFDLTGPDSLPGRPWDLVVCCEVAEHLKEKYAALLVKKLTEAGEVVFMTAAEPSPDGATGLYHYNEQPNEYWIKLMERAGWHLDEQATSNARECFAEKHVISYLAKAMVFRQGPALIDQQGADRPVRVPVH